MTIEQIAKKYAGFIIPGQMEAIIKKYLAPKRDNQTVDEAYVMYERASSFIGQDLGGLTDADIYTYEKLLNDYFVEIETVKREDQKK